MLRVEMAHYQPIPEVKTSFSKEILQVPAAQLESEKRKIGDLEMIKALLSDSLLPGAFLQDGMLQMQKFLTGY
jgi:hypothetical protein